MTSDGFGEAKPVGGEAHASVPNPADPYTLPAPPSPDKLPQQPPAIYHPSPPPGSVPSPAGLPLPPPFSPGANTDRNWMAIVSLVLGLLGGGLLGLGFGIAAVQAANAGRATNRTLAVWGIVLNCTMWVVYFAGFSVLGAIGSALAPPVAAEPGRDTVPGSAASDLVPVTEIPMGSCFVDPELEGGYYYGAAVVSCEVSHDSQVYAVGKLAEQAYVSEDHMGDVAWDICFSDESTAAIHPALAPELYGDVFYPSLEAWNQGDRGYVCFVWDESGPLSNSVLAADLDLTDAA